MQMRARDPIIRIFDFANMIANNIRSTPLGRKLWVTGTADLIGNDAQRWQSIPSRSIWLEIGSRLIEPSKGLSSKYRASNRTEPAFVHHRAESNLQLKCSMLGQAARFGSVILMDEYYTLLSCWADRSTVTR